MSSGLSDSNIELVENFISCNSVKSYTPGLSVSDVSNGQTCYQQILSSPPTSYMQFGSNSFGMTSYGLYKTRSNKIYVIEAFCNNITCYYTPEVCGLVLDAVMEMDMD
jgi:hypothetical protein